MPSPLESASEQTRALVFIQTNLKPIFLNPGITSYSSSASRRNSQRDSKLVERLTGFTEINYDETRSRLEIVGRELRSRINSRRYGIGRLELIPLRSLRERACSITCLPGRLKVRNVTGDVRHMHQLTEYSGALFQVASQFNLLEMVSPEVTPEHGVTRYDQDKTQGPACAIAAGAATIYRNYFAPVGGEFGQTSNRQLDGLADVAAALSGALRKPAGTLWTMRNGYALCSAEGLDAIGAHLSALDADETDALRALLRIGMHQDVEVTDGDFAGISVRHAGILLSASSVLYKCATWSVEVLCRISPRSRI